MSVPSASNPEGNHGENIFDHEFAAQTELLVRLHRYHENSATVDSTVKEGISELEEAQPLTTPKLFIWRDVDEHVFKKGGFDEMEWHPREGTESAVWIEKILVRFPRVRDEQLAQYADEEGAVAINDILLEINGDRYLLNRQGVVPYADGESVDFDDAEIRNPERKPDDKPDALTVTGDYHWAAPYLSASMLRKIVLLDSDYVQR